MTTQLRWPEGRGQFIDRPETSDRVDEVFVVEPGQIIEVDDPEVAEHYRSRGFEDYGPEPVPKPDDGSGDDGDAEDAEPEGDPDGEPDSEPTEDGDDGDADPTDGLAEKEPPEPEPKGDAPKLPFDPAEMSVPDLEDRLEDVDDVGALHALRTSEVDNKNRKTGLEAIDRRINDVAV